jgi:hypothetical protein
MEKVAYQRYDEFDQQRRATEARLADEEDLKELEQLEDQVKSQARTSDKNPDRD